MWLLLALLTGCPKEVAPSENSSISIPDLWRLPLPGLVDVACDGGRCLALRGNSLIHLPSLEAVPLPSSGSHDTLRFSEGAWELEGPCAAEPPGRCRQPVTLDPLELGAPVRLPLPPAAPTGEQKTLWKEAWNRAVAEGWRGAFHPFLLLPGAELQLSSGLDGAAQLRRNGENPAYIKLMLNANGPLLPTNLALHPTGTEAYLAAWPSPLLLALDPVSLDRRWVLPLDGGVQGLFIEPNGRFLLVASGDASFRPSGEWPQAQPNPAALQDPSGDEEIRNQVRPPMSQVYAVDLQDHSVRVELPGSWRRWIELPDGRILIATTQQLVFFKP